MADSWSMEPRPPYYVQTGWMGENPHGVPMSEIAKYVAENPPEVVAQVVFGKFVESSGVVFSAELIQTMFDRRIPVVTTPTYLHADYLTPDGQKQLALERKHGGWRNRFFTGIDFARQTDHTVITTIDTIELPARCVYWRRLNKVGWETIYAEVGRAVSMFGDHVLVDSTGMAGDVILDALESRLYCPYHHRVNLVDNPSCSGRGGEPLQIVDSKGKKRSCHRSDMFSLACADGYPFTGTTKKQLIEHLRNVLNVGYTSVRETDKSFGWIRMPPIPQLEEEMTLYLWDDKGLPTDCVMSLALAAWAGLEEPVRAPLVGSVYGS